MITFDYIKDEAEKGNFLYTERSSGVAYIQSKIVDDKGELTLVFTRVKPMKGVIVVLIIRNLVDFPMN